MVLSEEIKEMLETQISTSMAQMKIPGFSMAMIKEGQIVYERGFGTKDYFKNYPKKQAVTPNTVFEIGSISKSFTSLAVMQLHDQGKLDVDDPISKHLPWFKLGLPEHPIKIHHVLSHGSGIPDLGSAALSFASMLKLGIDLGTDPPMIPYTSEEDIIQHFNGAQSEILFKPGEKFYYFNDGYDLLGMLISAVSGEKYEDYVRKHIFEPLEMTMTHFPSDDIDTSTFDVTKHYMNHEGKVLEVPRTVDQINNPAGGVISSTREMATYLTFVMGDGTYKGKQIVSKESLAKMLSPHQIEDAGLAPQYNAEKFAHYGYGWIIHDGFYGYRMVEHSGGTGGAYAHAFMVPELNIAVVALSNIGAGPAPAYVAALLALMGNNPMEYQPPNPMAKIQPLLGKYQTYKGIGKVELTSKGEGVLYAELLMMGKIAIVPDHSDETGMTWIFNNPMMSMKIFFKKDANDKMCCIVERNLYHKID
jgi:CubicO group peptidase (beta-lactamase class C family)